MIPNFIKTNRDKILETAHKHGAVNVRIFGSAAKGNLNEESDVDFLVEMGPNPSPFFPGGLLMDLKEILNRDVDIVTPNGLNGRIRDQVLNEAIRL